MISVLDLFRIGIGPSSSHTVGPMRIARRFALGLERRGLLFDTGRIHVQLQGSLALTGIGHGAPDAALLGLLGRQPETVDPDEVAGLLATVKAGELSVLGRHTIAFNYQSDMDLACHIIPDVHPNGMMLTAFDETGTVLRQRTYYSTGGGFIASAEQLARPAEGDVINSGHAAPHPFTSATQLLTQCDTHGHTIAQVVMANEAQFRAPSQTDSGLDGIAATMNACIHRGLHQTGILPGGFQVRRRAPDLWAKLTSDGGDNEMEQLFDWLNVYAMAVNEENAAGGRVVTAPTNGAAGIIPAVLRRYVLDRNLPASAARDFLLTAGGIGLLYKQRASISGAEMGCPGEVGVACSMAAAGLAAVWGGTPMQVCAAAEIGMEHNLGLTCDPVGGLVQIPCIERNAIGAVKAVNAARLALHSEELPRVSLDQVIETMRQTGLDMSNKYKETSLGGLAVTVVAC